MKPTSFPYLVCGEVHGVRLGLRLRPSDALFGGHLMFDLPLWIQASFAFFFGGVFTLGCIAALWLLSWFPSVERALEEFLGGEVDA